MTLWTDSYQSSIDSISNYIKNNFTPYNDIPDNLFHLDDSVLADCIIVVAWRYFSNLYNNRRDSLNKYTLYNQRISNQGNTPSLQELMDDKFRFLNIILRIIFEYNFWASDDFGPPMFLRPEILEKLDKLKPASESSVNFIWIERSMPAALTKDLLLSEEFSALRMIAGSVGLFEEKITTEIKRGFSDVNKEADALKNNIEGLIKSAGATVQSLAEYDEKLKQYKSEYNFVLLSKAFSNLLKTKKAEYVTNHRSVIIFSSWLIATPLFALLNHIYNFFPVEFNLNSLFYYLPILSLELLFFYFMRLYYIEGKAIKAQLLQIEQRLSLCEFIHDYVETKNNSGAEKESWSLFEKLIFSPIQVSSENIPSLLDGASSIAELAGKVLSKDSK
ncbi:hypothetical protein INR28_24755 [Klebsiella pneumoniae]|jgi:hypothetical protein|uniref:hypothetical protein n=1 Tax=Klebsiella pneumoniae complex TaxID=3390273 RepID=UPI000936B8E5|nr:MULTISPECIES: hypothetical protein [Klebsiella]HBQ5789656.1 hypothetical protein [Klebsiella pneumoniae subsp. pneumoniae]EKZ5904129.1 hypothetical protein [Klebsiella pneumoniae]ELA2708946.1 hypothetical protein [Klebsiella pneumoniae]MBR7585020.1 hypothetical protein [Klebsiella variicola]MCC7845182.1 hypothetical protein [Klebsiella pneumoniae]